MVDVLKSISATLLKLTNWKEVGSQEHGKDVELNCYLVWVLASAAKSTAAT